MTRFNAWFVFEQNESKWQLEALICVRIWFVLYRDGAWFCEIQDKTISKNNDKSSFYGKTIVWLLRIYWGETLWIVSKAWSPRVIFHLPYSFCVFVQALSIKDIYNQEVFRPVDHILHERVCYWCVVIKLDKLTT